MRGIDTTVDKLDDLALPLLGGRVGSHHLRRRPGRDAGVSTAGSGAVLSVDLLVGDEGVVSIEESSLDASRRPDRTESRGRCLDGKSIEGVEVVAHIGNGGARTGRSHGLADARLHLRVVRGAVDSVITRVELDDDRAGRVIAGLLGRRGLGCVGVGPEGRGHAGRRECEGTGRYQRECYASVVEHCRLTFFTPKVLSCMRVSDRAAHPRGRTM